MTRPDRPPTRVEIDAYGNRVEIYWEIERPNHWWQRWTGQVVYRQLPAPDRHYGSFWCCWEPDFGAWTRRGIEGKLAEIERHSVLGFPRRRQLYTDGRQVWPG